MKQINYSKIIADRAKKIRQENFSNLFNVEYKYYSTPFGELGIFYNPENDYEMIIADRDGTIIEKGQGSSLIVDISKPMTNTHKEEIIRIIRVDEKFNMFEYTILNDDKTWSEIHTACIADITCIYPYKIHGADWVQIILSH